MNPLDTIRI